MNSKKRMVWHYEDGWQPLEDVKRQETFRNKIQGYQKELGAAHGLADLRRLDDMVTTDHSLTDEERLMIKNNILSTWKAITYGQPRDKTRNRKNVESSYDDDFSADET